MHLTKKGIASLALMGLTLSAAPAPVLSNSQVFFGGAVKPLLKYETFKEAAETPSEENKYKNEIQAGYGFKGISADGKAFAQIGTKFKYKSNITPELGLAFAGTSMKVDDLVAGFRLMNDATYALSVSAVRHNHRYDIFPSIVSNDKSTQGFLVDFSATTASVVDSIAAKFLWAHDHVTEDLKNSIWHAGIEVEGIAGSPVALGYQLADNTSAMSDSPTWKEKEAHEFRTSQLNVKFSPVVSGMAVAVEGEYIINHKAEKNTAGYADAEAFSYLPQDDNKYNTAQSAALCIGGIEEAGDFVFNLKAYQVGARAVTPYNHKVKQTQMTVATAAGTGGTTGNFAKIGNYQGFSVEGKWAAADNFTVGAEVANVQEYKEDIRTGTTGAGTAINSKKHYTKLELSANYTF